MRKTSERVVGVRIAISKHAVGGLEPDSSGNHFNELIMKTKNIVRKIRQHLVDIPTKIISTAIMFLLVFVAFLEPR